MKAMVLDRPAPIDERPLHLRNVPEPHAGPGEVRVRVSVCGVCHTDLHTVEGDLLAKLPIIPGHQVVGVVDEVGPWLATRGQPVAGTNAARPADGGLAVRVGVGTRVGVPWLHRTCGRCDYCARGDENLCESAQFTGFHHDGGYAEYMTVPAGFAAPLPEGFQDAEAAPLLCAGIIGYRSLRVAGLKPGETLALLGFGASAHIAIQIARYWGCEVLVFTRSQRHREMAMRLGASWAGGAGERPPAPADRAVTFAPAGYLVPEALKVLRRGGTLAINAIHLDGIPAFPYDLLYWEKAVRSVANATRRDAIEFLDLAAQIPVRAEVQVFKLEEANETLLALKNGDMQGAAVLHIAGQ